MAQQTVIGVFDSASDAQNAVDQLISNGFSRDSIDMSASRSDSMTNRSDYSTGSDDLIPDRHVNTSGTRTEEVVDDTKDVGSSIGDFFSNLFGSDSDDTRKYSDVANRGTIVTVHAQSEDEAERAADLLDEYGAVDVDERANEYGTSQYGTTGYAGADTNYAGTTGTTDYAGTTGTTNLTDNTDYNRTNAGYNTDTDYNTTDRVGTTDGDQTIKVIEENLQVGKREVERGGVRVRSRIIEKPVEESLRLREERVTVQRTPVNRPATEADLNAFQEGQIEVVEHAEVPVVSKTANVVEEISVGKEVNERTETVRDTVRSTDVQVENLPNTDRDATLRADRTTDLDDDLDNTSTYTNR
ncbi:DUF2382 domain-containing protein [Spirosoma aerophilum]